MFNRQNPASLGITRPNDRSGKALRCGLLLLLFAGCQSEDATVVEKKPRPVEVQSLAMQAPASSSLVSAVVGSWKTENLGMEVGGRIQRVAEPNTDIEARVRNEDGQVIIEGTPIAQIDRERYELQVQSAKADVNRAQQAIAAADIEIEKTIPSRLRAAEAERKRAQIEYDRSQRLVQQNAGPQVDVDRAETALSSAIAGIEQLNALLAARQAERQSLQSQLLQARQAQRDAELSLQDCTLYSSFNGQIARVLVVPGSVVAAGQGVATLQMMDPIKVEMEVSAEESRRLRNRQRLPVRIRLEDDTVQEQPGIVYLVDPVADSQTRTFTVTLLMVNQRMSQQDNVNSGLAATDQTWRLDFPFLPGAEAGKLYAPAQAIRHDDQGPFLWKVTNLTLNDPLPADRLLAVEKLRVNVNPVRLPFLGTWVFNQVVLADSTFDPAANMIVGKLQTPTGDPDRWNGSQVIVEKNQGQWMLRPGDLVEVDISENNPQPGYFVSMDAIARSNGKSYLFLIDEATNPPLVRRTEIRIIDSPNRVSSQLQVESMDDPISLNGRRYVTQGTHYLRDAEPVRIVSAEKP